MTLRQSMIFAMAALGAMLVAAPSGSLNAQGGGQASLTGGVSSQAEGKMEGVLVIARGATANHTVTVVSDVQGRYSFPRSHVPAGKYGITIRALGYDLASPGSVEVPVGKPASLDLTLDKTEDLASQLTSLDWIHIMPGTMEQKDKFVYQAASCNYCHSYQRILKSKHNAQQFVRVMKRMKGYYPDGAASSDDGRGHAELWQRYGDSYGGPTPTPPTQGDVDGPNWSYSQVPLTEFAEYLASVNVSGGRKTWPFEIKGTLPRPTGKGTRVIITQWDQPRKTTVSHDMDVDSMGRLWYSNEGGQYIGVLDPKTNVMTDFDLPPVPEDHLTGTRDLVVDWDDNVWFPMRVKGGGSPVTKFDPKTKKVTVVENSRAQFIARGPRPYIYTGGAGNPIGRINTETMKVEVFEGRGYQMVVDSKGNGYVGSGGMINGWDIKAGKLNQWTIPNPKGGPQMARRGHMDPQDRYWFANYYGDGLGMFDTKTETFKQWPLRKWSTPYAASIPDKKGRVYLGSNMSQRLLRVDTNTGEVVEYLMPTELDTKKIRLDPTTDRPVVLLANTRNARLLRVEPLD